MALGGHYELPTLVRQSAQFEQVIGAAIIVASSFFGNQLTVSFEPLNAISEMLQTSAFIVQYLGQDWNLDRTRSH